MNWIFKFKSIVLILIVIVLPSQNLFGKNWVDSAIELIELHEGWRSVVYYDSNKVKTIGYGFNLEEEYIIKAIRKYSKSTYKIEKDAGDKILRYLLNTVHIPSLKSIYPKFDNLPNSVKIALLDMHYNLGKTKLLKFKKMNKAINKRNFKLAAKEAYDSKWRNDVGNRADTIINLIKNRYYN